MTDVSASHYFGVFLWECKCGLDGKPHRGRTAGWRPCWCWAVRWSVKTNKAENKKITFWLSMKKKKKKLYSALISNCLPWLIFFSFSPPSRVMMMVTMMMLCLWICVSVSGRACCSWWKSRQAAASNTWKRDRRKRGLSEEDTDWRRSTAARRLLFATAE